MTYGFRANNKNNEVVIDSNFPAYEISSAYIINGSPQEVSSGYTMSGDPISEEAYSFPVPPSGTLRFWRLEVGDGISLTPNYFIGSKQSFFVRDVVRASLLPDPTGYGMVVYDETGSKVYASNGELLGIGDKYTVEWLFDGTRPPVNTSDSWVAIQTFVFNFDQSAVWSTGVEKMSSTQMRFYGVPFLPAAQGKIEVPATFITAK